jgi:hypothetical protein
LLLKNLRWKSARLDANCVAASSRQDGPHDSPRQHQQAARPSDPVHRRFDEAADLAELLTPEELSIPRDGERGKLGVA